MHVPRVFVRSFRDRESADYRTVSGLSTLRIVDPGHFGDAADHNAPSNGCQQCKGRRNGKCDGETSSAIDEEAGDKGRQHARQLPCDVLRAGPPAGRMRTRKRRRHGKAV